MTVKYGTPEFYAEQFADLLADVQSDSPEYGDALVKGFLMAFAEWKDYHANQVNEYNRIEQRVRASLPM
jgi:hypothetical protein